MWNIWAFWVIVSPKLQFIPTSTPTNYFSERSEEKTSLSINHYWKGVEFSKCYWNSGKIDLFFKRSTWDWHKKKEGSTEKYPICSFEHGKGSADAVEMFLLQSSWEPHQDAQHHGLHEVAEDFKWKLWRYSWVQVLLSHSKSTQTWFLQHRIKLLTLPSQSSAVNHKPLFRVRILELQNDLTPFTFIDHLLWSDEILC